MKFFFHVVLAGRDTSASVFKTDHWLVSLMTMADWFGESSDRTHFCRKSLTASVSVKTGVFSVPMYMLTRKPIGYYVARYCRISFILVKYKLPQVLKQKFLLLEKFTLLVQQEYINPWIWSELEKSYLNFWTIGKFSQKTNRTVLDKKTVRININLLIFFYNSKIKLFFNLIYCLSSDVNWIEFFTCLQHSTCMLRFLSPCDLSRCQSTSFRTHLIGLRLKNENPNSKSEVSVRPCVFNFDFWLK